MNRLEKTLSLYQVLSEALIITNDLYEHTKLMAESYQYSERSKHLSIHLDQKIKQVKNHFDQLKEHNEATHR